MDTIVLTFAFTMFLGFASLGMSCAFATLATWREDTRLYQASLAAYMPVEHAPAVVACTWVHRPRTLKGAHMPVFFTPMYEGV